MKRVRVVNNSPSDVRETRLTDIIIIRFKQESVHSFKLAAYNNCDSISLDKKFGFIRS